MSGRAWPAKARVTAAWSPRHIWRKIDRVDTSAYRAEDRRKEILAARREAGSAGTRRLVEGLRDKDPLNREWSIDGLVGRKDCADAVHELIERVDDPRADLRWYAARALGKLGISTTAVKAALKRALDDPDLFVRCYAAWSLGQLRVAEAVPMLRKRLLELRIEKGKKSSEEAFAVGVAIMRAQTELRSKDDRQAALFSSSADATPEDAGTLPKTKQETLKGDVFSMAEAVALDRSGEPITRTGRVATKWEALRSKIVKEKVRAKRGDECQLCGHTFRRKDGGWYSESHHIIDLAKGGPDDDENLLVVCPTHHKELHYADVSWPGGTKKPVEVVINGKLILIRWAS